jgi:hypothetical protein
MLVVVLLAIRRVVGSVLHSMVSLPIVWHDDMMARVLLYDRRVRCRRFAGGDWFVGYSLVHVGSGLQWCGMMNGMIGYKMACRGFAARACHSTVCSMVSSYRCLAYLMAMPSDDGGLC